MGRISFHLSFRFDHSRFLFVRHLIVARQVNFVQAVLPLYAMVSLILDETDSGMESLPESSKDLTPEKIPSLEDDYEVRISSFISYSFIKCVSINLLLFLQNEEDETLSERLLGLTEMFPESVRNAAYYSVVGCKNGLAGKYNERQHEIYSV